MQFAPHMVVVHPGTLTRYSRLGHASLPVDTCLFGPAIGLTGLFAGYHLVRYRAILPFRLRCSGANGKCNGKDSVAIASRDTSQARSAAIRSVAPPVFAGTAHRCQPRRCKAYQVFIVPAACCAPPYGTIRHCAGSR